MWLCQPYDSSLICTNAQDTEVPPVFNYKNSFICYNKLKIIYVLKAVF